MNMNDPHVDTLSYKVKIAKDTDYSKIPPLSKETDDFIFTIDGNIAKFKMKKHFSLEEEAKKLTDEFLDTWCVFSGLNSLLDEINFNYDGANIIDRNPPNGSHNILVSSTANIQCSVCIKISRNQYPPFPEKFKISDEVDIMYLHYKAYLQKRESLLHMANVCLTTLEGTTRGLGKKTRKASAGKYYIDFKILDTLGTICAEKGDKLDMRKYPKDGKIKPLTKEEKIWIEEAVRKIILRVGEYAFDPSKSMQKITIDDLPKM